MSRTAVRPYGSLQVSILRVLKGQELSGYDLYKALATKGMDVWPNHVYTVLVKMERDGLLKGRWTDARGKAPRKHLYSLSREGNAEYDTLVEDSLGLIMEHFFEKSLSFEDIGFHMRLSKEILGGLAKWSDGSAFRLVIVGPDYNPMVCFPKFYYSVSEAYPNADVYVVKRPWKRGLDGRKNLKVLDGSRDDIPLRDGFADYVLLQGFPNSSPVEATLEECSRVLRDDGSVFLEIPEILTKERRSPYVTNFPDFVLRLFYEHYGQDRIVEVEEVRNLLLHGFARVKSIDVRGKIIFYAEGKLPRTPASGLEILDMNPRTKRGVTAKRLA
ncbi:MAG: helix-turn-helix transcriptional regulator [Thaumarchaeota archaeon]|nr:helix-turn-helix transcriptional regulator [Nitrososphaerota archaeon]